MGNHPESGRIPKAFLAQLIEDAGPGNASPAQIESWLAMQWDRCTDDAFACQFAEGCPMPGAGVDDYRQRVIQVGGLSILIGIRSRGGGRLGGKPWPFVDLIATDAPLTPALGREVVAAALEALSVFRPHAARWRGPAFWSPWPGVQAEPDQWFLAGTLLEVSARQRQERDGDIRSALDLEMSLALVPLADAAQGAEFVRDGYREWSRRYAWFADRVVPIDAAGLEACRQASGAWWIQEGSTRAGLLALLPETNREWHGWCVHEELVHVAYAGRGLAARAQSLAARALIARQAVESRPGESGAGTTPGVISELIFGTIDDANQASLRTAEHAGRSRVGAYWWLRPD